MADGRRRPEHQDAVRARRKAAFLERFPAIGTITHTARAVGIQRRAVQRWLRADPVFAQRFRAAVEAYCDTLEREATRRAVEGVDEPVFQKGEQVGVVRRYSDRLLEILLRSNLPEKYRERHELTGAGGAPLAAITPAEIKVYQIHLPANGRDGGTEPIVISGTSPALPPGDEEGQSDA